MRNRHFQQSATQRDLIASAPGSVREQPIMSSVTRIIPQQAIPSLFVSSMVAPPTTMNLKLIWLTVRQRAQEQRGNDLILPAPTHPSPPGVFKGAPPVPLPADRGTCGVTIACISSTWSAAPVLTACVLSRPRCCMGALPLWSQGSCRVHSAASCTVGDNLLGQPLLLLRTSDCWDSACRPYASTATRACGKCSPPYERNSP